FAKDGKRYRSLGCAPCTGKIESEAKNVDDIIEELKNTTTSERAGRAQDQEDSYAMQKLRKDGYM
ncbi:MAG: sulfate adenylyltransferase subunit CysD, partial [Clostridium sp.]